MRRCRRCTAFVALHDVERAGTIRAFAILLWLRARALQWNFAESFGIEPTL